MYESVIGVGSNLIATYGLGILLLVFALEGALIGKIIPTRALFVATVLAIGTDAIGLLSVFVVAVVGATVGQLVVFTLVRRTAVTPSTVPDRTGRIDTTRLERWFDRWGLSAITVTNFLPVVRGTLTVPAAVTDAGYVRFSAAAFIGTALYVGILLTFAVGLELLVSPFV